MENKRKIAIIGGTGFVGSYVLKGLLKKGFDVRMLVRNPQKVAVSDKFVEIVTGDAKNYDSIYNLLNGCDAVISTLGQDFKEKPMFLTATENIIKAANSLKIERYIMLAGIAINAADDQKSFRIRFLSGMMKFFFAKTIKDKQKAFNLLASGNLNWTVVRVPMIKEKTKTSELKTNFSDCKGQVVNVEQLSNFMIEQIDNNAFIKRAPFIYN